MRANFEAGVVHYLFEPGNGGLDRVAILLANGMAERGVPTQLWLSRKEGPLAGLISDKVLVRLVPTVPFGNRGLKLFLQIPALARMIRRHRPAAIFSAGNQSNLVIALARRLAGRVPTRVIQKITNPIVRPEMGRVTGEARKHRFQATAALGDMCLTLSEADARNYAREMPAVAARFRAVRNPYVSDQMLELGKERKDRARSETCNLLSVGRMEFQKDHATLLRALARLRDLRWRLRILGDGPLRNSLQDLAETLQIDDRIVFEGFVPNPAEVFAQSDILVLSSRWEGLPAVALEAMACGCDVVATDCSDGLRELLGETGRKVARVGDDGALADLIRTAMSGEQAGGQMRDISYQYGVAQSVEHHLQQLGNLVSSH